MSLIKVKITEVVEPPGGVGPCTVTFETVASNNGAFQVGNWHQIETDTTTAPPKQGPPK